ncbi:uncharacterized protein LOC124924575 [Impatiens glandulifera]|uniref:uncharacterized protein LOC124924575 n=1 Tax=Impatiens glandulifera TaxID=253017 RepID=UPI001FB080D0|nr:uncharacterized protein LOC124924575 [Impatiens glandulifera]
MESAEPPSDTRDEDDSASSSDRTASHNTEDNESGKEKGPTEHEQSASIETDADDRGEENVPVENDQKIAENIVRRIMEEINLYVAGTPKAKLQLLVLDILEVKKEFIDEIERIEAVRRQRDTAHSPRLETGDGQNPGNTSHLADPVINETDERTETPFTGPLETDQPGDSEPVVIEERVKSLIQEFANSKVRPWKRKIKKAAVQTIKLAETTRDNLVKAEARITEIEVNYRDDTVLKIEQRLTKVDEDLGHSSTEADSTLNRVRSLEEKNASLEDGNTKLEADLNALTEQVNELINAKLDADTAVEEANARADKELQDDLDKQNRTEKGAAQSDKNFDEHVRILMANDPEYAKTVAAKQAEEANRLKAQQDTYHNFEKAHKKSKAASSSSVPTKRKRKVSAKKAQVTELLDRITETAVEEDHFEVDFEEDLEPRPTRQWVLNAVPISTVGQPQAGGSSSRPAQPDEDQPTDDLMTGFLPSELE